MRISVSSDMDEPVARTLVDELRARGHDVVAVRRPEPRRGPAVGRLLRGRGP